MTQEHVSRQFEWHAAKVNRIETARVAVTPRDVKDLLSLYDVRDHDYREVLVMLARSSRDRAWWTQYRDIVRPDSFVALESEATAMRNWEPVVIPGLLQTEAYMRALFSTMLSIDRRPHLDRAVSLRIARQRRLTDDDPLKLHAIIDESVVHRQIGGELVMAEQLRHLLAVAKLPAVTLRILPYRAGEHLLLATSMVILDFGAAADLDIVYVEGFGRAGRYMKEAAKVDHYREVFDRLSSRCLNAEETTTLVEDLITA